MMELKRPVDMCASKVGFRQIALLYLLKGDFIHEDMWRNWFVASSGKIPILEEGNICKQSGKLANAKKNDLKRYCHVVEDEKLSNRRTVIEEQHLYDVWVHIPRYADAANIVESSIFGPYVLPKSFRVDANWGSHSLIDATRVLYAAALTNPLNSKFLLISEADVPLYNSLFVYRQLDSEEKSRINACNVTLSKDWSWNPNEGYRLRPDMIKSGFSHERWRKSWQWTSLLRNHARSVVQDRDVDDLFRTYCRPRWDESWCDFRVCYSDEHYIPTLFSFLGLDNETDCAGELTDRDWSRVKSTDAHPYAYQPSEIDMDLLLELRHPEREGCRVVLDNLQADKYFVTAKDVSDINSSTLCEASKMNKKDLLGPLCPLLARKFLENTVDVVLKAAMPLHAASSRTRLSEEREMY